MRLSEVVRGPLSFSGREGQTDERKLPCLPEHRKEGVRVRDVDRVCVRRRSPNASIQRRRRRRLRRRCRHFPTASSRR